MSICTFDCKETIKNDYAYVLHDELRFYIHDRNQESVTDPTFQIYLKFSRTSYNIPNQCLILDFREDPLLLFEMLSRESLVILSDKGELSTRGISEFIEGGRRYFASHSALARSSSSLSFSKSLRSSSLLQYRRLFSCRRSQVSLRAISSISADAPSNEMPLLLTPLPVKAARSSRDKGDGI